MNFKGIIFKNLKSSIRYYLAYFLCIALSIAFFFILVNLINDFNVKSAYGIPDMLAVVVSIPLVVLGVFSIFFISYVNGTLIKRISKELGLFLALGMDKRKVSTIVFLNNIIIGSAATVFGLLLGTVFSRLFFITILKIMDLKNIPFGLHLKSYFYTLIMFVIIFSYLLIRSLFIAKKLDINELLKENRKKEDIGFKSPVWGIIGMILIVSSFIVNIKFINVKGLSQIVFFGTITGTFIGLNLFLSQLHNLTSFLSKRNKALWYKNLLFNTNLRHRISSNKKFIFALTISYFVMFMFGIMTYHEYTRIETVVKEGNTYDLTYVESRSDKIDNSFLEKTIKEQNVSITKEEKLQFIEMSIESESAIFIYDENYNNVFDKSLTLTKGNAISLERFTSTAAMEEPINIKATFFNNEYKFKINSVLNNVYISRHPDLIKSIYLISKEDFYEIIKQQNNEHSNIIYLYNLNEWKKGYEIEKVIPEVYSLMGEVKKSKSEHGLLFFLFSFICLIFFISSGSLVYFKYFSQLENDKIIYKKLMRIGISHKEVKVMIGKDMIFTFFIPCMIGALIGFIYMFIFYPSYQRLNLSIAGFQFISMCLIFQTIYYLVTKKRVYHEVINYIKY
ncbi:FtsX-like permease family protein [Oceanirhabdus sp. W0125-5]|uniref:FtsX-like permease family protein n=1 Tax=Oceanirhabdus sp. W0125-5 TaxID=2999116 RepID=UPI0022F2D579|nr:ABC transporter permease [Oceanirhabdus sp. W0125-5]WBW97252.1 ABC transporter permease [Oceanirhabdus sp. W0125-5]